MKQWLHPTIAMCRPGAIGSTNVMASHGERWVPQHWSEHNGRYHFDDGHWERG